MAKRAMSHIQSVPVVSVIIPVYNARDVLERCLEALFTSTYRDFECIVVDDGATDNSLELARKFPTRIVSVPLGPLGPAHARNLGAAAACGSILFFVDADVALHPGALAAAVATYEREPNVVAVFGSYDDNPESMDFVSQYKNLLHHFIHQQAHEEGGTFWSGCGSIRRDIFADLGGFDDRLYHRPSIEDIELGYRLRAAGHRILLNKEMQATHLKRWTLRRMVESDLFDRAIPWALLGLRSRNLPNDLNLHYTQRLSAALACVAIGVLAAEAAWSLKHSLVLVILAALLLLLVSYWPWSDVRRRVVSAAAYIAILAMAGAIGGAFVMAGEWPLAVLIMPGFVGGLSAFTGVRLGQWGGEALFKLSLLGVASVGAAILLDSPRWSALIVAACVLSIAALNWRLYVFFARRRGVLFACSVVPFHLFYYVYCVLGVALSAVIHLWRRCAGLGVAARCHGRG